ncbi:methyltransferase [Aliiroseovarius subalbicans]|uniref:class I SAM-dependent methyltransferase n=1 Tax=Aliiroseovarius subalbicans TaxID=2925840 RepID=UPI001F58D1CC|nr:methyltransferase [Aliiroseovarius subalbicans]MCI2399414.1 methyltransferase [Aliiroseovarius subalbicans]
MAPSRLTLALENGALLLPADGRIAVFAAPAGTDLSALEKNRTQIIQGQFPDYAAWVRAGWDTQVSPKGEFAAAVVFVPRAKAAARALVHQASQVTGAGLIVLDGQKTDGIDSLMKAVKVLQPLDGSFSKAHGKLAWFTGGDFTDWGARDTTLAGGFVTRPGVFSADAPDKGSVALVEALPKDLTGRVVDLGAGWGFLARDILGRDGVTHLDLIEADHAALTCARRNIDDARAEFVWGDATSFEPKALADIVISNPPFHVGRAGDPGLGRAFIRAAARILKPTGQFFMVANRHLPYEAELAEQFREVAEIGGTPGFKVLHGAKPRRQRR